jgi:S-adenosylmethionine hydrolase
VENRLITLLSDFGLRDPYVAEMKGVILNICSEAKIVDISHEIEKFDVHMGAFLLASAAPYFPTGTIHVAVIDPGVGTERCPIIVEDERFRFVGPDNGVLMLAASQREKPRVYIIENRKFMLPNVSSTFHGRDIFAPAAAYLARGRPASEMGRETSSYVMPSFAQPSLMKNSICGEVIYTDGFGNIVTNISAGMLDRIAFRKSETLKCMIGKRSVALDLLPAYGNVSKGKPLAILGSHSFLEISINQGNAARKFEAKAGDPIRLER